MRHQRRHPLPASARSCAKRRPPPGQVDVFLVQQVRSARSNSFCRASRGGAQYSSKPRCVPFYTRSAPPGLTFPVRRFCTETVSPRCAPQLYVYASRPRISDQKRVLRLLARTTELHTVLCRHVLYTIALDIIIIPLFSSNHYVGGDKWKKCCLQTAQLVPIWAETVLSACSAYVPTGS